jgi:hypothetical protein
MMGLGSNGFFVTGAPYLNVGHGYGFASSVDHPRLDSIRQLIYDNMCTYLGHRCCITGPSRQRQPCQLGVNVLSRSYGMNYDKYAYKYFFSMISPALNYEYCH